MALCGNCGAEGPRIRTTFSGCQSKDECPKCAPQSFEKISDPSTQKIWIGPEYAPNDYTKHYDKDGVYYMPKPEVTAERNAKAFVDTDEQKRYAEALEKKRRTRRTEPMTPTEISHAVKQADNWLRPLIEDPDVSYDA